MPSIPRTQVQDMLKGLIAAARQLEAGPVSALPPSKELGAATLRGNQVTLHKGRHGSGLPLLTSSSAPADGLKEVGASSLALARSSAPAGIELAESERSSRMALVGSGSRPGAVSGSGDGGDDEEEDEGSRSSVGRGGGLAVHRLDTMKWGSTSSSGSVSSSSGSQRDVWRD